MALRHDEENRKKIENGRPCNIVKSFNKIDAIRRAKQARKISTIALF